MIEVALQLSHWEVLLFADAAGNYRLSRQQLKLLADVAVVLSVFCWDFVEPVAGLVEAGATFVTIDYGAARFTLRLAIEAYLTLGVYLLCL